MRLVVNRLSALAAAGALLTGCLPTRRSPLAAPMRLPAGVADSVITDRIAAGARLHRIVNLTAPWRAHVLEVDLTCTTLRALKGSPTAVGRTTTSRLLAALPDSARAVAAINADFFLSAPPGVPTNLHVEQGLVITGPGPKPVVLVEAGRVAIDTVVVQGEVARGDARVPLVAWNRPAPMRAGVVDARWGVPLDTSVRRNAWRLDPLPVGRDRAERASGSSSAAASAAASAALRGTYVVRAARPGDTLAVGDTLLLHLPPPRAARTPARAPTRAAPLQLADGDTVRLDVALAVGGRRTAIADAVSGRPIVLADSAITADADTEGNAGFRQLNPRSAIGIDRGATRAWIAVIDGRQPGYSMGMTLRQVGALMQALGATHALNLDGGGSSALVVRRPGGTAAPVNRPSDPTERAVGNALAVLSRCRER